MEEQKGKVVEMSPQTKEAKPQKMSYEELEQVANQLSEQARQLYNQLQKSNMSNMFKRLDYLFKVVESGSKFRSDFLDKCIKEIEDIMTVPDDTENSEEEIPDIETEK